MQDGPGTDERVESPYPRRKDMDSRFLRGCMTIAVLSLVFFAMLVWPGYVFPLQSRWGLTMLGVCGALPVLLIGIVAVRRLGAEGATALVGGSFAGAVNAFLRMDMLSLGRYDETQNLVRPDYPEFWVWAVPVTWCLAVLSLVLLSLPKPGATDEGGPPADR